MSASVNDDVLPTWEVFMQKKNGGAHEHVGNVHAADSELALQSARDVYGRRGGNGTIWVIPIEAISSSGSDDEAPFFDPADDKIYRYQNHYRVSKVIKKL